MRFLFLIICSVLPLSVTESSASGYKKYTLPEYIEAFKDLAVNEMNRSGVPASITLSQGILESGFGNSILAKMANNHFGIKNKPDWKGETYTIGNSCYKKYKSVFDSFQDHSNHIISRKWYFFLFSLKQTDYKGWAHGLKKAGYAQDTNYAWRLISLIERYKLNEYDNLYLPKDTLKK